jgi:hypothetical protein
MITSKKQVRLIVHVDAEMAAMLRAQSAETGAPVGELIRSAIRLSQFADAQGGKSCPS